VVLPIHNADVRAEVGGAVEAIYADEGDWVRAGDVIARLSDRDNRAALLKTEADIDQMQAQLRLLQSGPRREEIELAKIGIVRTAARSSFAKTNLERDQELSQQKLISLKEFETSRQAVLDGENELAEARQRLQVLLAGSRPEEIDAIKAGIARLETQRRYLVEQLEHVNETSPAAGIVATPSRDLKEMSGQVVKEGDLIAKVHELKTVEVQTSVSEKDIADIRIGQPVALKARAYPEQVFLGTVASVGTTVQGAAAAGANGVAPSTSSGMGPPSARTILVTTRIANDALLLRPGMTGMVKISCGDRRLFELLTRRLARTIKVEFWSWW
jgi:multidrug resistance efflux pump